MDRSWTPLAGAALLLTLGASPEARLTPASLHPTPSVVTRPLAFEINRGQANPQTEFVARATMYVVHLMSSDARLSIDGSSSVRLVFAGAADSNPQPLDRQNLRARYQDPAPAHDVPTYGRVKYPDTYPGIDVIYSGKHGELELDLDVAPGADLSQVRIHVAGGDALRIDDDGALRIRVGGNEIRIDAPTLYHDPEHSRAAVAGSFRLGPNNTVSIAPAPPGTSHRVTI